jgi:hypothetical protein
MIVRIPVAFQPIVGQVQEFRVKGLVTAVDAHSDIPGQWVATIEITDPLMAAESMGMPRHDKNRSITLREEMWGKDS